MGSDKSGRWLGSAKKVCTEECLRLTVSDLRDSGIVSGKADDVLFSWKTSEKEGDVATVRVRVASRSSTRIVACLAYTVHLDGKPHEVSESIHLVKAAKNEGANWWIRCHAHVDGEACDRQVGTLYLPPGQQYFACKHCHDLAHPWSKKGEKTKGHDMDEAKDIQLGDKEQTTADTEEQPRQVADKAQADEPDPTPPPRPLLYYIDHTIRQLDPENTTVSNEGRVKLVGELLSKMTRECGLSEERFSQAISEVQARAPKAFATYATKLLRDGDFSVVIEQAEACFPLHRMGRIIRLHLVHDLQLDRAGDLMLVDAAVDAFVQAKILLNRGTWLSPDNGPLPDEEKTFRTQAVAQQKLFTGIMEKLLVKPARSPGRSPARKTR